MSQVVRLAESTPEETERLLGILIDARLITPRGHDGGYRTHDLVLAYARNLPR